MTPLNVIADDILDDKADIPKLRLSMLMEGEESQPWLDEIAELFEVPLSSFVDQVSDNDSEESSEEGSEDSPDGESDDDVEEEDDDLEMEDSN